MALRDVHCHWGAAAWLHRHWPAALASCASGAPRRALAAAGGRAGRCAAVLVVRAKGCRAKRGLDRRSHALCASGTTLLHAQGTRAHLMHARAPAAAAGFWAAATAAFHRRFHMTTYKEGARWQLLLLWPLLLVISPEFRQQFLAVVRGLRAQGEQGEQPPSDGSAFAAPGMPAGKQA